MNASVLPKTQKCSISQSLYILIRYHKQKQLCEKYPSLKLKEKEHETVRIDMERVNNADEYTMHPFLMFHLLLPSFSMFCAWFSVLSFSQKNGMHSIQIH